MSRKFINRKEELKFLNERYRSNKFELIIIYGRRRVGKTELIRQFIKDKKAIYLFCDKGGTVSNINRLKKKISELFNEPLIATNDLEEIFNYLSKREDKLIIVFDEFPYLIEKDESFLSVLQRTIDNVLIDTKFKLILLGSSISMMEEILIQKSPLYGRKTMHLKIKPLKFKDFFEFYRNNNFIKNFQFWSTIDGIPLYMQEFNENKDVFTNIKEIIANKTGRLYEEIDFLLKEELREPWIYKKILEAIANGKNRLSEISDYLFLQPNKVSKYIDVLIRLDFIKREYPLLEKKVKTKKTWYIINDNFIDFYMNFIEPVKDYLEIENFERLDYLLNKKFNLYLSKKFEKLVEKELVYYINLPFKFTKIGRQFGSYRVKENGKIKTKTYEIDLIALNEQTKEIAFIECKWQDKVNPKEIVKELEKKTKYVDWYNEERKEYFVIFAKSFKKKIEEYEGRRVYCFDLKDMEKVINKKY